MNSVKQLIINDFYLGKEVLHKIKSECHHKLMQQSWQAEGVVV